MRGCARPSALRSCAAVAQGRQSPLARDRYTPRPANKAATGLVGFGSFYPPLVCLGSLPHDAAALFQGTSRDCLSRGAFACDVGPRPAPTPNIQCYFERARLCALPRASWLRVAWPSGLSSPCAPSGLLPLALCANRPRRLCVSCRRRGFARARSTPSRCPPNNHAVPFAHSLSPTSQDQTYRAGGAQPQGLTRRPTIATLCSHQRGTGSLPPSWHVPAPPRMGVMSTARRSRAVRAASAHQPHLADAFPSPPGPSLPGPIESKALPQYLPSSRTMCSWKRSRSAAATLQTAESKPSCAMCAFVLPAARLKAVPKPLRPPERQQRALPRTATIKYDGGVASKLGAAMSSGLEGAWRSEAMPSRRASAMNRASFVSASGCRKRATSPPALRETEWKSPAQSKRRAGGRQRWAAAVGK